MVLYLLLLKKYPLKHFVLNCAIANMEKRKSIKSKNKMLLMNKLFDCRSRFLKVFWPSKVHCPHVPKCNIFIERISPGSRYFSLDFYSLFHRPWSATLHSWSYKTCQKICIKDQSAKIIILKKHVFFKFSLIDLFCWTSVTKLILKLRKCLFICEWVSQ